MAWFNDLWARFGKVIPLVEDPADATKGVNLKAGAHQGLAVEGVAGGTAIPVSGTVTVDVSTLATHAKQDTLAGVVATQTTLAAINTKMTACNTGAVTVSSCALPTGAATSALQTAQGIRHTTTPSKADAATGQLEVDKRGSAFVNASLRHVRRIPLTSGLAASAASFAEGACDCLRVTTADVVVYAQCPETALLVSTIGSDWTGAAGWTMAGNVWTHANAGGTGDLEYTIPTGLTVGDTALVCYGLTWTSGTSVTEKLGTGAGDARSSTATHRKLITSAGSAKIIFTPTDDAVCSIDVSTVRVITATPPMAANTWEPQAALNVVALATKATPATADTTTAVYAGWYRRAAAVEVT